MCKWLLRGMVLIIMFVAWVESGLATPLYGRGCEFPMEGVQVCWEASGEAGSDFLPFTELHVLPIAREMGGDTQLLEDYTRTIYRQLLPGEMTTGRFIQEWTPVVHLEEALVLAKRKGWPLTMWIAPRQMRESRSATSGLVDFDIYLISGKKGQLVRTVRVRVESHPEKHYFQAGKAVGPALALGLAGAMAVAPITAMVGIGASGQTSRPRDAGVSLELMTELAVRQLLFVFQYPMEELKPPTSNDNIPLPSLPMMPTQSAG